jgi:hypothetical protein
MIYSIISFAWKHSAPIFLLGEKSASIQSEEHNSYWVILLNCSPYRVSQAVAALPADSPVSIENRRHSVIGIV